MVNFYKPTKYKQTPIGEVPDGWEVAILLNLINNNKKSSLKVEDADVVGSYPFFTSGDNILRHSEYLVEGENLFLSTGGSAYIKFYDGKAAYSTDTWSVKAKNIYPRFLFYQIFFLRNLINITCFSGSGLKHLDKRRFLDLNIIKPQKTEEQQKISEVLSKIDEAIEEGKKSIEKWQRIKKAAMRQLLTRGIGHKKFKYVEGIGEIPEGWEVKRLEKVFALEYGKALDKKYRKSDGEYPVYGANGVKDRSDMFYYDKKTLVIGRKGSAGEIVLTESKFWPLDVTYYIVFDDKKYDLLFLYSLLKFIDLTKLAHGVKPGLNRNDVYDIKVSLPPLSEQQKIASILQKIDQVIETKQQKQKHLERVKREMMRLLLTGRVRIKI